VRVQLDRASFVDQEYEADVALDRLKLHPDNPNQGDLGALMESIAVNGWAGAVWAQRSTGYVLDGNHRLIAAREFKLAAVPVIWLDVDDAQAIRLAIAANRIARLGLDDQAILADLLSQLATTDAGVAGTGYDSDDLDRLLKDLAGDVDQLDMPEPKGKPFTVQIICRDRDEQTEALQRLRALGFEAKAK
jgi:ParB-like chromosome segregation protein Spo0J